jgi:hypothetical protein
MSRRTRRPAAASLPPTFHGEDTDAPQCLRLSDHLKSRHSEDTEAHEASAESEATEESDTQQQQQQEEECQDDSRRFSLQELIQDETGGAVDGERDAATGGHGGGDPAANVAVAHGVSGAAAAGRSEEQVVGRKVIGMMRRYVRVRVRSVKTKHARAPEKNVVPQLLLLRSARNSVNRVNSVASCCAVSVFEKMFVIPVY